MKTKLSAILIVVLCTLFTSTAQIFYKLGSAKLPIIFTNWYLFLGLFLYGIGAVLLITSFKGGDVSVLYPIIATSYIWVTILSKVIFNEQINIYKIIGVFCILIGIISIGFGSKKEEKIVPEVI